MHLECDSNAQNHRNIGQDSASTKPPTARADEHEGPYKDCIRGTPQTDNAPA